MAANFPRGSLIRRVNAEPCLLAMAGRALVLQLAHPAVAQGVADHSNFQHNPFRRLQGTMEAEYAIVFGSEELARGVGRRLRWIHDYITGPGYQANTPENLLWVHATLMDSALNAYTTFVRPLSLDLQETYYQQMRRVPEPLGLRFDQQPATLAEFNEYFADTVASLQVTEAGRQLMGDIVRPRLPYRLHVPLAPGLALHRLLTVGFTPPPLREQSGFAWDDRRQRTFDRWVRALRFGNRVVPRPLRVLPGWLNGRLLLWLAGRHVRQFELRQAAGQPPTEVIDPDGREAG